MKPVYQTLFGVDDGDCLQAVLASVLELELEQVPEMPAGLDNTLWLETMNEWLERWYGVYLLFVSCEMDEPPGYHLIYSEADDDLSHVAVGLDGKQVHDPDPHGGSPMLVTMYGLFVTKLDNRKTRRPIKPLPRR